ncbi:alanine dehydrogenase [Carboxydochorda subterranea]|uniref:Alanine dehydrogenase n=1 Tax=Carboxydichorda subterranea TaxID=3109565 RepID=A0ABZ1BW15_9FIRM|nr:alanine dehydrogenase [Limnochorda sp. L945t]WRP16303.1 alanine dehydrogenase [Limnochorda sp. L945t]
MIIGVPREIKPGENRVAIVPAGVEELTRRGHRVLVEEGAGRGSGILDEEFLSAGAILRKQAEEIYAEADLILKVKEPQPSEYPLLRRGQVVFTYLHLAADRALTVALVERGIVGIAYETIQLPDGSLPLLTPMSEVAGRMSVQVGAQFLEKVHGGRGILLGGVPGVPGAEVVILGGGTVGFNAARIALGMGAHVTVIDSNVPRLRFLEEVLQGNLITVVSNRYNIDRAVRYADLVIGAVLIPGARAPRLVTEEMVRAMKEGSVIVDVAVDQGGCIETVDRATTHDDPVFVKHGVVHYAVANIPGAVPRTSTYALTNCTLPYVLELADKGWKAAVRASRPLALGVNLLEGSVTYEAVARAHDLPYVPLAEAM